MSNLSSAFGTKDQLRIRTFELNGTTFKVKVPLTSENEAMYERTKIVNPDLVEKYYANMSKEFFDNKSKYENDEQVIFKDNDVILKDISIRELCNSKVITENRITELFKLLIPADENFDMQNITYQDIDAEFPFNIQTEIIEKISEVIAPSYSVAKGK